MATFQPSHYNPAAKTPAQLLAETRRKVVRAAAVAKRREARPAQGSTGHKMTRPTDEPLDLMIVDVEEESGRGLMSYLPWVLGGVAALGLGVYFVRRR